MAPWILPAIFGGTQLLSNLFGNRQQNRQNQAELQLQRDIFDWNRMFQERQFQAGQEGNWWDRWRSTFGQRTETGYHQDTDTEGTSTSTTTPFVRSGYRGLEGSLQNVLDTRLQSDPLPAGYAEGGVRDINKTFDSVNGAVMAALASKGLAASPAGANAVRNYEGARGSEISRFLTGLPLVSRELQNQDIGIVAQILQSLGLGSETISNFESHSNTSGGSNTVTQYLPTDSTQFGIPMGFLPGQEGNVSGGPATNPRTELEGSARASSGTRNLLAFLYGQGLLT